MDETRDETPEDLDEPPPLVPEAPNRYAVPLTVLVGGAYVGLTEQVAVHDDPAVLQASAGGEVFGGWGDGDSD